MAWKPYPFQRHIPVEQMYGSTLALPPGAVVVPYVNVDVITIVFN